MANAANVAPVLAPRPEGRRLPAGESWPADTALLLMTYAKNERYIAPARENLSHFWPNHPRLYVVTDGDLTGDDVICQPGLGFAELLQHALDAVVNRQPGVRYVYVLLEDLAPLGPVDEVYMRAVENTVRDRAGAFVNVLCQGSGKHRAYPLAEAAFGADAQRLGLREIAPDATAFNCLVVCCWEVAHLRAVVAHKIATGQSSPWDFEHPDADIHAAHYTAEDCWPSWPSGFLKLGRLSKHIDRPHGFPDSPLLDMVEAEHRAATPWTDRIGRRMKWRLRAAIKKTGARP